MRTVLALLAVVALGAVAGASLPAAGADTAGHTRVYYIAADEVDWNYVPSGMNKITGQALHMPSGPTVDRIGSVYRKAIYREYTDATFRHLAPRPPSDAYLGFLGPVIHAAVGDTVTIVFKNNARFPFNLHPDGLVQRSGPGDAPVPPGRRVTYVFYVPAQAGPGPDDPSSVVYAYHSDVDVVADASSGLMGPIIVTRRSDALPDGRPKDVDREIVTMFAMTDENTSRYFDDNSRRFTGRPASAQDENPFHVFYTTNEIPSINGYSYGNMPPPVMVAGQRVRWYLLAGASDAVEFHTVHWHGNTVLDHGHRTDMLPLAPASTHVVDMTPDNPGLWMFHCHVSVHFMGGMVNLYRVLPSGLATPFRGDGVTRTYYIAADEVDWHYAPSGRNLITGTRLEVPSGPKADRIGLVYRKAVYHQYTDATFRHQVVRPPDQAYLGIVGPVLRASVGDTIKVVFRNNTHFPFSMHPHGLLYDKFSEGATYVDGRPAAARLGGAVPPGGTYTYVWHVPERAGPGPADPDSIVWMYHSHVAEVPDLSSGLIGPIIVTRRGAAGVDGKPVGVDRELVLFFLRFDENTSPYFDANSRRFTGRPASAQDEDPNHPFYQSNEIATIDGFAFGNMPVPSMRQGERVRWYVVAGASDYDDAHVPSWQANTVLVNGSRVDTIPLDPMMMAVADMRPTLPGLWNVQCMVPLHRETGMIARYRVEPAR
jgi:hephaestin